MPGFADIKESGRALIKTELSKNKKKPQKCQYVLLRVRRELIKGQLS